MAKNKMKKKKSFLSGLLKFLAVILALAFIAAGSAIFLFMHFNSPVKADGIVDLFEQDGVSRMPDGSFIFEVRRGESSQSVGRRLERAGLIRSRYFWDLLSRRRGDFIKPGTYPISNTSTQLEIYDILVTGRVELVRVTIPEGVTIRRAAIILEDSGICYAQEFIKAASDPETVSRYRIPNETMEGYLFPDTYLFERGFSAERVVTVMADNFFNQINNFPGLTGMSREEINQIVILASIVQGEYRVADEAPLMAGVFRNRLRIGMMLQSCATVKYVITEILGREHPQRILYADLEIPSPYNTYLVSGLPPSPISSPGAVALRAAFEPATTDFFFFTLIDEQAGRHHFSGTNAEHERATQLFRAGQ